MRHSNCETPGFRPRLRGLLLLVLGNVAVLAVLMALLEGLLVLMLNHPPPVHFVLRALSGYYEAADRPIIQLMPECSIYHEELGYTLKPGTCRFRAREFDTTIEVNSAGLRDDEQSLESPEIVVIGDSFAMGWGVEGSEAFASLLESQCRKRVLNAAISSYGTARQVEMLRRFDLSAVGRLVVQYSDNDHGENRQFAENGDRVVPMSAQEYERLRDALRAERRYYPGKHLTGFVANIGQRLRSRAGSLGTADRHASSSADVGATEVDAFLHVLSKAPPLPTGARVSILEINGSSGNDGEFAQELVRAIESGRHQIPWGSLQVLDVAADLTEEVFFRLDEHLSVEGHATIARLLAEALQCDPGAD